MHFLQLILSIIMLALVSAQTTLPVPAGGVIPSSKSTTTLPALPEAPVAPWDTTAGTPTTKMATPVSALPSELAAPDKTLDEDEDKTVNKTTRRMDVPGVTTTGTDSKTIIVPSAAPSTSLSSGAGHLRIVITSLMVALVAATAAV